MDKDFVALAQRRMQVSLEAESLLGERGWFLLSCFGKLMSGPDSGFYVSGIACAEQLALVKRLVAGNVVDVHLMHRHQSGDYEVSRLRWSEGKLLMVFKDREVVA